jgi:hypothetical protein
MVVIMGKDKNQVYMCMSCGNCKRSDDETGCAFSFTCKCGDFLIDAPFASKIEFIGCRSWKPADDNYNEPFFIKIDEKHKTVEIGKWGKTFKALDPNEFSNICSYYENDDDGFSAMMNECHEVYGE